MKIIPVVDLLNSTVVHAKYGNRHQYLPVQSLLTSSTDMVSVVSALLSHMPFDTLYIADLSSIIHKTPQIEIISSVQKLFPQLTMWIDAGFDNVSMLQEWQKKIRFHPVIGSESIDNLEQFNALKKASNASPILSLDYRDGRFLGEIELLRNRSLWPEDVILMNLNHVGSNSGNDLQLLQYILAKKPKNLYSAGGLKNQEDLKQLKHIGVAGALTATALHQKNL